MRVRPAARLVAAAALVLGFAAACGPVAEPPPPPATAESDPQGAQADAGRADGSPLPSTAGSDPSGAGVDGGPADGSPPPTTVASDPPSTEADGAAVDGSSSPPTPVATEAPPEPTSVDAAGPGALSADERSLVDAWRSAASASAGVWPGFDMASIPTVLATIDGEGAVEAAVAFNHPNPAALGTRIRSLDVDGHQIAVVGEVADPDRLASLVPFDFFADVGGVSTYAVVSGEGELDLEPGTPSFVALVVHEGFHRYQFDAWAQSATDQYFDGYD